MKMYYKPINQYIQSAASDALKIPLQMSSENIDWAPVNLDNLKKLLKEKLSPEEYKIWEENIRQDDQDQSCLVKNFFRNQQSLPPHLQKDYCHISCPCPHCSPRM